MMKVCPDCDGLGIAGGKGVTPEISCEPPDPCPKCQGKGTVESEPVIIIDSKRTNVSLVVVSEYSDSLPPGSAIYHPDSNRLQFACPGCGQWGGIRIRSVGNPKFSASWDIVSGTTDDPTTLTVSPSIHCKGCCGWHGYLRNGVFISC